MLLAYIPIFYFYLLLIFVAGARFVTVSPKGNSSGPCGILGGPSR